MVKVSNLVLCCVLLLTSVACSAQPVALKPLAFPQAEGYGKYTVGGRGGRIIVVDSLEDSEKARPGTLRYAAKAKGPRIVVFTVSGAIQLVKPLEIKEDFITIAGQTSPKGIVITGSETQIDASQVIIRYIHFRPGAAHEQGDAVTAKRQSNIIIDHCSMSWANDEVASFYNNTDFTLQYSIISESLNNAGHKKGSHGYGGIWGGKRASFIHNVLAHHTSRNPRINGFRLKPTYPQQDELVDLRNNIVYNWSNNSAYGNENGQLNFVNNMYIQGPAKSDARFFLIEHPDEMGQAYFKQNVMLGHDDLTINNQLGVEIKDQKHKNQTEIDRIKQQFFVNQPFISSEFLLNDLTISAQDNYIRLIENREVGANRNRLGYYQDSVDQRVLGEVQTKTATVSNGIIDTETQVISDWQTYFAEFFYSGDATLPKEVNAQTIQSWIDSLGNF